MNIQKPYRATHSYNQILDAVPDQVFPLLCPVRELDWVPGWNPLTVWSAAGVAEREAIFTTLDSGDQAIWVVSHFDPNAFRIEFVKVIPRRTVTVIRVALHAHSDSRTMAVVEYSVTALSEEGEKVVSTFSDDYYVRFMQEWERALNHFLTTGEKIEPDA